jgi:hypothetical protein
VTLDPLLTGRQNLVVTGVWATSTQAWLHVGRS